METTTTLGRRVLAWLRDNSPATARQITEGLGDTIRATTFHYQRTWVNTELAKMRKRGHVKLTATIPTTRYRTPSYLWEITPEGRKWLAEPHTGRYTRGATANVRAIARAHREANIEYLLREMNANNWGPWMSIPERHKVARQLRDMGLELVPIGEIFGVGRESVRNYLLGATYRNGRKYYAGELEDASA